MKFIKLTLNNEDNEVIYLNSDYIKYMAENEMEGGTSIIMFIGTEEEYTNVQDEMSVKETPEEIIKMIEE